MDVSIGEKKSFFSHHTEKIKELVSLVKSNSSPVSHLNTSRSIHVELKSTSSVLRDIGVRSDLATIALIVAGVVKLEYVVRPDSKVDEFIKELNDLENLGSFDFQEYYDLFSVMYSLGAMYGLDEFSYNNYVPLDPDPSIDKNLKLCEVKFNYAEHRIKRLQSMIGHKA